MKKRALTLLEILIVIFLITLITGAIGYSMKGTLDKGRAFRTEQAAAQLRDLLLLCVADGHDIEEVATKPAKFLTDYGLAKNPEQLVKDGWGKPFSIRPNRARNDFDIKSDLLIRYQQKTGHQPSADASDSDEG